MVVKQRRMTRRAALVSSGLITGLLVLPTASVAAADLGPASDTARCVGEFASTGGTQLGSAFGQFVAITGAQGLSPFGKNIVMVQAHGTQPDCPIPIETLPLP